MFCYCRIEPGDILERTDGDATLICPYCMIDAVITDALLPTWMTLEEVKSQLKKWHADAWSEDSTKDMAILPMREGKKKTAYTL